MGWERGATVSLFFKSRLKLILTIKNHAKVFVGCVATDKPLHQERQSHSDAPYIISKKFGYNIIIGFVYTRRGMALVRRYEIVDFF
ncbi:MAG: hypothetical protein EAZ90_16900 [Oscillatoriales cyanobacterium]|nr:MAG: hypothetical protein EAZ94_17515 [Oscillatoriales cyanobacterium]TAE22463.1 MAG: hypothetical protein EAZ93_18190 [Oscillatoriales cyanobacterium]TAE41866.1 MAG: hypothetical protein EAZ90_16900 [Oscillatoriales cyanobacterium]TAE52555.1 MAG: hypothetical protein EAZ88_14830 [Oscillatoriales cyanobacterium]TAE69959.1 MAG: hypothetical protein EAZ86_08155 [Oscillatoriales cyanobacterium]